MVTTEDPSSGQPASRMERAVASDVVVFGEVLFDHFPDGSTVLGGAPFNVAWHLRGFGLDPMCVTAVGDDAEGREVLTRMESWGLRTDGVRVVSGAPTGRVLVRDDPEGPGFEVPESQAWDAIPVPEALDLAGSPPAFVYHGTLAQRSAPSAETLRALLASRKTRAFVDVNLRSPWWREEVVEQSLARARWIKMSAEELAALTGQPTGRVSECRAVALEFASEHGLPHLMVTRGAEGCLLVSDGQSVMRVGARTVPDLVDTVGAGDAFSAVFCVGVVEGWDRRQTLERAVHFASDLCRVRGATSPDLALYERHQASWESGALPGSATRDRSRGLYVMSLSVHGLVRGGEIELGRDADTGGQVSYVVDQARALADLDEVDRVDVVTRLIRDPRIDASYSVHHEPLGGGASIVRLPFGPKRYLRKESLWPHLDDLLDQVTRFVREQGRVPDVVHGHYADAGYVGAQLAQVLGVPFIFTGHSLGRIKRARLLSDGEDAAELEERYHLSQRIEAEERALESAALVITSTQHEIREQYARYDHYEPTRKEVIPPGVDLSRFSPPSGDESDPYIVGLFSRFLRDVDKPMVLAVARPDPRKNFRGLIRAFAETRALREAANLVLVAGTRDDIRQASSGPRGVFTDILLDVDRYDLYGSVAIPKAHRPADVPEFYRLAARSRGVFANTALTEPFGLTLIEAAASGLPVVATNDGGPQDIVATLENGLLVDPLDAAEVGRSLLKVIESRSQWDRWASNGAQRVHDSFAWEAHATHYVREVSRVLARSRPASVPDHRSRLLGLDRLLLVDVDGTLTGDPEGAAALRDRLAEFPAHVGFGLVTGRTRGGALRAIDELGLPSPHVLITGSGTRIGYGRRLVDDRSWERRIRFAWDPDAVVEVIAGMDGVSRSGGAHDTEYRLRYLLEPGGPATQAAVHAALRQAGLRVSTLRDEGHILDILPVRASPRAAVRFFGFKWNLAPGRVLVVGDSEADLDFLSGETLGVVVGNHAEELEVLRGTPRTYFAEGRHGWGVLEGIDWYSFLGTIRPEGLEAT